MDFVKTLNGNQTTTEASPAQKALRRARTFATLAFAVERWQSGLTRTPGK
jgi:hypothetical protein